MLIHLHTEDGRAMITIDPEGGAFPLIETMQSPSARATSFRLRWADDAEASGRTDRNWIGEPTLRQPAIQRVEMAPTAAGGSRLRRYAAMTGAFAVMLVVGMVIGTLRGGSEPDPAFRVPQLRTAPLSAQSYGRARARVPEPPIGRVAPSSPPAAQFIAPEPADAPPPDPLPPAPVSRRPLPANPGALFGLHS